MLISLIAAVGEGNIIGAEGQMPFNFYADKMFFKAKTSGSVVVMGRKTYQSLPVPHLEGRVNVVLSNDILFNPKEVLVMKGTPEEVIEYARRYDKDLFVIGGASVYKQFLPYTNCMWITEVYGDFKGDTEFPNYNRDEWVQFHNSPIIEEDGYEMRFTGYKRR